MAVTVQRLINNAFKKLAVLGVGETPTAEMSQDAMESINLMLHSWSIRGVTALFTFTDNIPINATTEVYTIGPTGASFTAVRPITIEQASVKDLNNIYTTVDVISADQYLSYGDRLIIQGRPCNLWYEPTMPNGTITLYYKPNQNYTLQIHSVKPLTDVELLSEEVDLDIAYQEAIIYNLAVRIAPDYGVDPKPPVVAEAERLFDILLRRTAPEMTIFPDVMLRKPNAQTIFTIN